jgi:hypothetical protein
MPISIAKSLGSVQEDPDYAFTKFPMPYDITINAKGAGTKEVDYQVVARPAEHTAYGYGASRYG